MLSFVIFEPWVLYYIISVLYSGQDIRKLSETTGPTEAKLYVATPWGREKDGNLIHMIYM